tara:strand:- start:280 stop:1107 length:828 start_codon:yes stop_codon:yes gene_type:complete
MAKLDEIFKVLENWQSRSSRNKNGVWDDKYSIGGGNNSTLNGGRPLSPMRSLDELSNAEIEQIRREWGGKAAADVNFSNDPFVGFKPKQKRNMLDGSPISQFNLDRINLDGRPQPGRNLESFNDVPMPDYDYRGGRIDNPNVRRGDDRALQAPNESEVGRTATELPGVRQDYALGNTQIPEIDSSLFGGGEGMLPGASSPIDDYYLQQGMNAMDIGQQSKKMGRGIDITEQINSRNIGIDSQNPVNIDNMSPSQYTNDKAREAILRARNKLTDLF